MSISTKTVKWTVPMRPIGKPRMTIRDRWAKRPCVLRYRAWADEFRLRAPMRNLPQRPLALHVYCLIPMPKSWPKWKQAEMLGQIHDEKPDFDNIGKTVSDVLFSEDKTIGVGHVDSYWCGVDDTPAMTITVSGEG